MAKKVVAYTVLIDDLDGTELPRGEGQSIRYGWKGTEYEIDLSDQHANDLETMMTNLVSKSVKVGKSIGRAPKRAVEKGNDTPALPSGESTYQAKMRQREFLKEIRAWARENGFPDHPATGRIREAARDAWNTAHPERPAPDETAWHTKSAIDRMTNSH